MELPRLPVPAEPAPIRYTVGNIRSLLYFGDEQSGSYCMHRTGRNIIRISLPNLVTHQQVGQSTLRNRPQILVARYRTIETHIQVSSRFAVRHIPHLGLAATAVSLPCESVIRMHLHRQHIVRVDELHQYRKLQSVGIVHLLSDQVAHIDFGYLLQIVRLEKTVGHYRNISFHTGYLPTFADTSGSSGQFCGQSLSCLHKPVAPPYLGLQDRFEL